MDSTIALYNPSDQDMDLVRKTIAKDLDEKEFNLFMAVCTAHGLNPILRQIHPVKYEGRVVFQVGIDGFRLQAERSKKYKGQIGPYWCGDDGEWKDVWLSDAPPVAARVGVFKEGTSDPLTGGYIPFWGIAKFKSFAKWFKDKSGKPYLGKVWVTSPDNQLAKCAEAQAIRKAFPAETSALFVKEEMWDEETSRQIDKENAMGAEPPGKPDVEMPEKNITPPKAESPGKPGSSEASIKQIKEMLDEMDADRATRDKFVNKLKKEGHEKTIDAVTSEYSLWLDKQTANENK